MCEKSQKIVDIASEHGLQAYFYDGEWQIHVPRTPDYYKVGIAVDRALSNMTGLDIRKVAGTNLYRFFIAIK